MTDLPQTCPEHPRALIRHSWRTTQLEYPDGEPAVGQADLGWLGWTEAHAYECAACGKALAEPGPEGRRWRKRTPEELAAIAEEARKA